MRLVSEWLAPRSNSAMDATLIQRRYARRAVRVIANVSWHMKLLALAITEKAKTHIATLLSSRAPGSVPVLMYGRSQTYSADGGLKEETNWNWQLQVYSKEQAESLQRDFAAKGHEIIFHVDGVVLCVPQFQFIEQLEGKTVDVTSGSICIK